MHLPLALSIAVHCVSKIMSTVKRIVCSLQNWSPPCYSECLLKRIRAAMDIYSKARIKDRSFLRSIWPCNPHVFCSSYLLGCIFCYCCISVKRNTHSGKFVPMKCKEYSLDFLSFLYFSNARVKQWIIPGNAWTHANQQLCHLQPTAVCLCALGRRGLQKSVCWKWAQGLHQEMENYFCPLCTFLLSSPGFFLGMILYSLALSLFFPFWCFFSAFVSHSYQFSSGPSSRFSSVTSDSCWTEPHCSEKDRAPSPVKISQYDTMKDQKCPLLHTLWRSGSIFIFEVSPALRRRLG